MRILHTSDWHLGRSFGPVSLLEHQVNGGVGAAIVTGYEAALAEGLDLVAVMAADAIFGPPR